MNTSFEPILLKKLLYSGEYFGKTMPILKNKFFTNIGNQKLFNLVSDHYSKYKEIPSLTELVAQVKSVPNAEIRAEIIKSLQEISKIDEPKNVQFMLDETVSWIKDALYMEALQIGSDGLMQKDDTKKLKAQKLMDEMAKVSIDSDLGLDFDDIDEMIRYYAERSIGILTQHKELNKRLGTGFIPGTFSVILAAAGIGKSLLMTDLISGMIKQSRNVLLVSLEMADKEIMKRVHANALDLPINSLTDLSKTEGELNKIRTGDESRDIVTKDMIISSYNKLKMSGTVGKLFIKDYPAGSFSSLMLEQLIESYKIEKGITFDAVFVDYVGLMKSDLISPSAGLYSYIKSIGEEFRAVAKKTGTAFISASQLNRSAVNNVDDADNSSVSDSLGTVMTADFMLFLLQNEEMKERKEIVCKVTKNRFNGRTDTWLMNIDYEHMRFNDMLIQNVQHDIQEIEGITSSTESLKDDFGIITASKQKKAESFANEEVKSIYREDISKVKNSGSGKTVADELDEIYKDLLSI